MNGVIAAVINTGIWKNRTDSDAAAGWMGVGGCSRSGSGGHFAEK